MSTASNQTAQAAFALTRTELDVGTRPEVRIVHIGLGAFHRAHQAWYTAQSDPQGQWGIAAFTGRSRTAADQLNAQDGLYTLVTRGPEQDDFQMLGVIAEAHDGGALDALAELVARPSTAVVTLTITEAGYHVVSGPDGHRLDTAEASVAADLQSLRGHVREGIFDTSDSSESGEGALTGQQVVTAAARLVVALAARRAAGSGPLAVVSCDNLPGNGAVARAAVVGTAAQIDQDLADWISAEVSFVDTSIDRITPKTTSADREAVAAATGRDDQAPVVTEPFSSWVLSGEFPAGRPRWEDAGAIFVDDLEAFERRKLWMLNGAHSLMAYAGQLRGHATVSAALADVAVSGWVEELWDAAAAHLTDPVLDISGYREALRGRFENPRIAHHLAQIGVDGSLKLAARAVPIVRAERAAGREGTAALRAIAAWMDHVTTQLSAGEHVPDPAAEELSAAVKNGTGGAALPTSTDAAAAQQTRALLAVIDSEMAQRGDVVAAIQALRGTFTD